MEILKNLLVVGGTGFIGSAFLRSVVKSDFQSITSISRNLPDDVNRCEGVTYLAVDVSNAASLKAYLSEDYDFVVFAGGDVDHSSFWQGGKEVIANHLVSLTNIVFHLNATKIKRFIYLGSSDEYGAIHAPQHEAQNMEPMTPYSFSKSAAALFLQMLARSQGFPATVLRLFLVYGPGQDSNRFIPFVIKKCREDETIDMSTGEQERDFCHIDDVIRAIHLAIDDQQSFGEIINIGSGEPRRIKDVAITIRDHIGGGHLNFGALQARKFESPALVADISKAKCLLGWVPQCDFDASLRDLCLA